ncbi:DUF309 domain-containing protein [Halovenus rubra]|uniref:DUF309 domain-containing protein n=2 Tax=Halovenus rubra TaxID=869890 RepID=A0ABD5X3U6_9EURY|nr:DUF309 domain-containing protein [Halovenus rubra]
MESYLRAGVAIYNAGEYHAAHDAWENHWLNLTQGTDDEQFLHGLIQFTAAVYHAHNRNWSGATGLAASATDYLADLSATYRGVDLGSVNRYLVALNNDPERVERQRPLRLAYKGSVVGFGDLDFNETAIAAEVLAEEHGYDEAMVRQAIDFARADLDSEQTASPFVTFLFDFVREPDQRGIILQRLEEHVTRRVHRESDVSGLFDARE